MLLRHIHYFIAVAEQQSFTRAAQTLYVSQPALSQQIRQLEERLGATLFDRSGRKMVLTDAGEVYYRYARKALQDLDEGQRAIHDVQDLSRGRLRLAITPTFVNYLVGPLVAGFYRDYPGVRLELKELSQEQIETALLADELDLGIAFDAVHHQEIEARPLLQETLALVVNEQHPLLAQTGDRHTPAGKEVLQGLAMALLNGSFATREQIDRYCQLHELQPDVVMQANSMSAVLEAVRCAPLATLLPADIAHLQQGLKAIALQPAPLQRQAVLLRRKGAYCPAVATAFEAQLMAYCQQLMP